MEHTHKQLVFSACYFQLMWTEIGMLILEHYWRRSQESHLVANHVEFIDYFPMRFTDVPPIMPPHVFP